MRYVKTVSAPVPVKKDILKNASNIKVKMIPDLRKLVPTDT